MSYDALRSANIARNNIKLRELGLDTLRNELQLHAKTSNRSTTITRQRKRKRIPTAPTRHSRRTKNLPPPPRYTPQSADDDRKALQSERNEEIAEGFRRSDGSWRGERFGNVKEVKVGTVFGRGNYQREGRFEMAKNGFFKPKVTCEWIDTSTKEVFSIVVNNDNGLSQDFGDVLHYAGAGGRRRGQNRTAEQSFHQTWESATNAALRRNQKSGRPIRVIRGPKCESQGTKNSGGGYRYDGLYLVEKAEMVVHGRRKLKTAMFTLRRI
jgi:hypothetical protein